MALCQCSFAAAENIAIPCTQDIDEMQTVLDAWGEVFMFGAEHAGEFVSVFMGPGGSWSLVRTMPDGQTCLIEAGSLDLGEPA